MRWQKDAGNGVTAVLAGLLMCGLTIAGIGCAAEKNAPPAQGENPATVDEERADWSKPVTAMWAARAQKQQAEGGIDVLFVGDSITQLWLGDKRHPNGQEVWTRKIAPLKACNVGVAGDRTENLLWRIRAGKMLDGLKAKVIVLMIGVNNLTGWSGRSGGDTPEHVAAAIGEIIGELQARFPGCPVLLLGILPALDKDKPIRAKIAKTNELLQTMQDGKKVVYLNFGDKFLAPDGSAPKEYLHDSVHLTPAAYEIWAEQMLPVLQPLLVGR